MASNINKSYSEEMHMVPSDSNRNQIMSARTFMTRQIILANTNKLEVIVPKGCYEAILKSNSSFNVFESSDTYVENSITYGTGISGTLITVPCESNSFYISGTTSQVIDIMFPSLRG